MDPWEHSLVEVSELLARREISPVELTRALLDRIASRDGALHTYLRVTAEHALAQARAAETELARGTRRGPLHGVPIAVKDLFATRGIPTTCGSALLRDRVPDFDATVVARLAEAGAVLLGKLHMTEFALAGYHPTLPAPVNPWNADHWPGVSSSGSAAAVAARLCFASLGTDTGGSIRFPAAACGVVGLKPSYGRVSRYGVFPLSFSLDHVGPFGRCVADAAAVLGVVAGADMRDPTCLRAPVPDYRDGIESGPAGVRIGVDERYCREQVDPGLAEAVLAAARELEAQGTRIETVRVPPVDEVMSAWAVLCGGDALVAHADTFPARSDEYGPAFRAFLEAARGFSAADYARAHALRLAFAGRLRGIFEDVDVLLCPSMPLPPPPLTALDPDRGLAPEALALLRFTAPFDFSGSPTLSLPCGFTPDGLPLSVQLVGRPLEEALICRVGHAYERATPWHARRPPLA